MYCKYRIVESIASSVSQYESYRDQVYRYTPCLNTYCDKMHEWVMNIHYQHESPKGDS